MRAADPALPFPCLPSDIGAPQLSSCVACATALTAFGNCVWQGNVKLEKGDVGSEDVIHLLFWVCCENSSCSQRSPQLHVVTSRCHAPLQVCYFWRREDGDSQPRWFSLWGELHLFMVTREFRTRWEHLYLLARNLREQGQVLI